MIATTQQLRPHLQSFDFDKLMIEELGWNYPTHHSFPIVADSHHYELSPVAEKAGFAVYKCSPNANGDVPEYSVRRKIDTLVSQANYEHLIIFTNASQTRQVWQWMKRESKKSPQSRELRYESGQTGEALLQRLRGITFTLDEEAELSITDVTGKVSQALDVERVTKQFYERFRNELTAFQQFISGFANQGDKDWYASLMLNRMMFIYFMQKQGFLDNDEHYLWNRLRKVQEQDGPDQFQRFYRQFLLRLFHEGLGRPEAERSEELNALLGKVPYLNGGIFDMHELERNNSEANIPDNAFAQIFRFFDQYQWHLDERPRANDNEINPDVLGYIFEKYINQKQMGAYYTKEDITGYISRNTVIPRLFDLAQRECQVAFTPQGGIWPLLQQDPERYIYPAVGHGIVWDYSPDGSVALEKPLELPPHIAAGHNDTTQREDWHSEAPREYALPAETWRELIARRNRYHEVRSKLASGEVQSISDCITYNLDIEQFAKDVISLSEGPELVRAFWLALNKISILDPACGSGAFLFAALKILEPLYNACLQAMQHFIAQSANTHRGRRSKALQDFRRTLDDVAKHDSRSYYILKSIVINNLYGVDIMEEAVEICRLRLFLKLVAHLETYDQIEPLPDIDFNIQAGNTMVGFTSLETVRKAMKVTLSGQRRMVSDDIEQNMHGIEAKAGRIAREFQHFQSIQTEYGMPAADLAQSKQQLQGDLDNLRGKLDALLAGEYGVDSAAEDAFTRWKRSHRPFHWFVEFHSEISGGGFDVVVGNPPYIGAAKVKTQYAVKNLHTAACPDIYAMVMERGISILCNEGWSGMIVPISLTCNHDFQPLRQRLFTECGANWFSSFSRIPSGLFSHGTRTRNTIHIGRKEHKDESRHFTTRLHRWSAQRRSTLFDEIEYAQFPTDAFAGKIPKIGNRRLIEAR